MKSWSGRKKQWQNGQGARRNRPTARVSRIQNLKSTPLISLSSFVGHAGHDESSLAMSGRSADRMNVRCS